MSLFRAHVTRLFAFGVALAGVLPVLYCLALLAWQYVSRVQTGSWLPLPASAVFGEHSFAFLPHLPSAWLANEALIWVLERLHVGVPFALIGLPLIVLGVRRVMRQNAMIEMEKRRNEDRLRRLRLRQYGESERIEPFIGPGGPAHNDADARQQRKEAA